MLRGVAVYGWFWMNEFGAGSFSSSTWRSSRIEWIAENPTQLGEFELFLNMKWYALFHLAFPDICWIIIKSRLAIGWIWCSLSFSFLCYLLRLFCQSEFRIMLNAHDKIAPSQEKVIDISNISIMRISMSICWIFFFFQCRRWNANHEACKRSIPFYAPTENRAELPHWPLPMYDVISVIDLCSASLVKTIQ